MSRRLALILVAGCAAPVSAQVIGPSTQQVPQFLPADPNSGVITYSIASNGNNINLPDETYPLLGAAAGSYRLVGIPDGTGAIRTPQDIAEGTFTWVVQHELNTNQGIVRAHGNTGAFVSLWRVRTNPGQPNHLEVIGGRDLNTSAYLYNTTTNQYDMFNAASPMPVGFGRFCSGDTAVPSAYKFGAFGTDERIHMNGEEIGAPGRAFANILTGPEAGTIWEVPRLGDFSWETSAACPHPQLKTIVVGVDDSTPGAAYFYVGTKTDTGNTIERAGLTNGNLYGVVIADVTINASGQPVESRQYGIGNEISGPSFSKPFTMYNFGDVTQVSGTQLQSIGDQNGVINWLRPEDGQWDPKDNSKFYFVTTDSFSGNSRIWMIDFTDIENPEQGGMATMLFDGSNAAATASGGFYSATGLTDVRMMDNFCTTPNNQLIIQEDVGNNARLGRIWLYDIGADSITELAHARADMFLSGGSNFITQDEESSGIIDAADIVGPGWFLLNNQSHFGVGGELVELGQLLAMYVPATIGTQCYANCDGSTQDPILNVADFGCFLTKFAAGDSYANCDGSTEPPVLNVADFGCYLGKFAAGCR